MYCTVIGLPNNFWEQSYIPPKEEAPCIIDHLCRKHDGITVEAMGIKEYSWKVNMKRLFDNGVSMNGVTNSVRQLTILN